MVANEQSGPRSVRPVRVHRWYPFASSLAAFVCGVMIAISPTCAQSVFSNGGNDGSLALKSGGQIELSLTKDIARLIYQSEQQRKHNASRFGAELRAKPGGDVAPLFADRKFAKGAGATLSLGQSYIARRLHPEDTQLHDAFLHVWSEKFGQATLSKEDKGSPSLAELNNSITRMQQEELTLQRESLFAEKVVEDKRKALLDAITAGRDPTQPQQEWRDAQKTLEAKKSAYAAKTGELKEAKNQKIAREADKSAFEDIVRQSKSDNKPVPKYLTERILGDKTILVLLDEGTASYSREARESAEYRLKPMGSGLTYDQLDLRLSYDFTQYKLLNTSAPALADQIKSQDFNGWSVLLAYNAEFTTHSKWNYVLGIAGSYARTNNADDLQKVQVQDTILSTPAGSPTRQVTRTRDVLVGPLKTGNSGVVALDAVLYPGPLGQRVAISGFYRTRRLGIDPGTKDTSGFGIFLTKKGAPRQVIGGLIVTFEADEKPRVDFSVGFNFGVQ